MKLARFAYLSALVLILGGCRDLTAKLPAGSMNPEYYKSPEAAYEMAQNVRYEFQYHLLDYMFESALFTDEFFDDRNQNKVIGNFDKIIVLDQRYMPDDGLTTPRLGNIFDEIASFSKLQRVRAIASLANRSLASHNIDSFSRIRAEMFVYEALANVMLAELYCSGIPLSTVDFDGDYSYSPGILTPDIYRLSEALVDTALSLVDPNDSIYLLSSLVKGRILLASARYSEAALSVQEIPDGFSFQLPRLRLPVSSSNPRGAVWATLAGSKYYVADSKGTNGIPYIGSNDPRIKYTVQFNSDASTYHRPAERLNLTVVTYLDARLIEAEADLSVDGNKWLDILNDLRQSVAGLSPLVDPGLSTLPSGKSAKDARVDLLFSERAFWLFFTGRRQGDLRRLVRNYNRSIGSVYPTGDYPSGSGSFEQYIDIPIPNSERFNSQYSGCAGRGH